jgi:predicted nuclease with TOPRIM domain
MDYVEETYEKYYGENGKFLTDYEKNFFGSDGILDWNELTIEEKDARWQEIQDTMAQIETEKASIETRMTELQEAGLEDSYEYQILQQRLDYLTDLHEVYDGLISNENISGVMTERRGY